jgi:YggT family protein
MCRYKRRMTALGLIDLLLAFCTMFVLARLILSWLIGYGMLTDNNPRVKSVHMFFVGATNPALRPIRLILPDAGDIDVSPVVLIVVILAIRYLIELYPLWAAP